MNSYSSKNMLLKHVIIIILLLFLINTVGNLYTVLAEATELHEIGIRCRRTVGTAVRRKD